MSGLMFSTGLNANTDANCGESYDDGANVENFSLTDLSNTFAD